MCAADMLAQSDWAALPLEIWQQVYLQAAGDRQAAARDAGAPWVLWVRLVAVGCTVCKQLRAALTGPGASALWDHTGLRSTYEGLSTQQSRAINAWLSAQGHHARNASLFGGDWETSELQAAASALTHVTTIRLEGIDSPAETRCLSGVLSGCPATTVFCEGSQLGALPSAAQALYFHARPDGEAAAEDHLELSQALLVSLQPLAHLRSLHLHIACLPLSTSNVQRLSDWHPQLRHLDLHLFAADEAEADEHELGALRNLHEVRLRLSVTLLHASLATTVLRRLQCVPLRSLTLSLRKNQLTTAQEVLLAECTIRKRVTLRCTDAAWRLQQPLAPGVQVVYEPLACEWQA